MFPKYVYLLLSVRKVFIFSWMFNVLGFYTLILHEIRTRKGLVYYFLALKVEKIRGSMLIDYNGRVATLDRHNFCHESQLRNSEINVTHEALCFDHSSIMKFISPYQKLA